MTTAQSWHLNGKVLVACNCDSGQYTALGPFEDQVAL